MIDRSTFHISEYLKSAQRSFLTINSGFESLNSFGGYPKGAVTIVAGYPGMGVSSFMISSMINMAKDNRPCLYFSLKNSASTIMRMAVSNFLQRDGLAPYQCSEKKFVEVAERSSFPNLPIHFCDNSNLTVEELDSIIDIKDQLPLAEADNFAPHVVFIDDLSSIQNQEFDGSKDKLSGICSDLAIIARKYEIAIVLGHSLDKHDYPLRRDITDERPILSKLRYDAEIEQHCAKVLFLHRPEYFKIAVSEEGLPTQGLLEIIVAKNSTGLTGSLKMKFVGRYARVEEAGCYETLHSITKMD